MLLDVILVLYRNQISKEIYMKARILMLAFVVLASGAFLQDTFAASIGINFIGGHGGGPAGTSLGAAEVAGVVPQANYNNFAGANGANLALIDSNAAATSAQLTYNGGGTFTSSTNVPSGSDESLAQGFVFGTVTGTLSNIPYATYDLYLYLENDAGGRNTDTFANNVANTITSISIAGGNAGQVDGNAGTPFNYIQGVGAANGTGRNSANFVVFRGLTGPIATFQTSAPGNGSLSGIQVVDVATIPEPATALLGLGGLAALVLRRRRA